MLGLTNISDVKYSRLDMSGISDQEMQIFSWVLFGAVCLAIDAFGIITNTINIICFVKQSFHDSINISLFALAVSDLFSLITLSWTIICLTPGMQTADMIFDPLEVSYLISSTPHFFFSVLSSWITALIALERCLCVTAPLKIRSIFTSKRTAAIIICFSIILLASISPVYTVSKLEMKFSQPRNKTILGLVFTENRHHVQKLIFIINNLSFPLISFGLIAVCTVILVVKLHKMSKWRGRSIDKVHGDRVSSRNQKVAKMATVISIFFIMCFIPVCITLTAVGFEPALCYGGKYLKIGIICGGISFLLESFNSSFNIVIYYFMSSKYRECVLKMFCWHRK